MKLRSSQRFGLAFIALFFGLGVLTVSLVATSQVISSGGQLTGSRKFYLAAEILPDHVLYPLFMVFDKVKLENADPREEVLLAIVYSDRRLAHAQALMEKGDEKLAVATLSKSQKYLLSAVQKADAAGFDNQEKKHLSELVINRSDKIKDLTLDYTDEHKTVLIQLAEETKTVAENLRQELKN
jgi:hypothetical protein